MNKPPKNKSLKSAGEEYGFEAKSGRGTSGESSRSRTSNHYSFKISRWIDKNKKDNVVQKHFPRHDGNGGNVMMYHARKGKIHPLAKHPDFPSDARAYLQYTKDNLKEDTDLLDEIINKNFDIAETLLKGHLASIVESKLNEKKKMCAAEMTDYPDLPKSGQKLRKGLTEDETEPPFEKPYGKVESGSNAKKDAERLARKAMKAQKEKADKESKEQVNEMVGKDRLSNKKKKKLSQRINKKMDDEQEKLLGRKFDLKTHKADADILSKSKKYMRMSTMKSKLDYPEYFKEEDLEEASLKQAYTKAKKFFGHKKRVSDAATKAMDSDSWEKNLAKVTKVVKKND